MKDKRNSKGKQEADRIRVFVRVRPLTTDEQKKGEKPGVEISPDRAEIKLNDTRERRYKFDKVFHLSSTNKEVFNSIGRPLVDTAFNGFNGTLMAYGQTGSGKTYTLMSSDGIAVQCVDKLFRRICQDSYHQYKVYMSYLQIYQEKIYDLLNQNGKMELYLREDPKRGVFVENLTEYVVRSTSEVFNLLRAGKKRLVFAETRMNRVSSRSHAVCQITVERSRNKDPVKPVILYCYELCKEKFDVDKLLWANRVKEADVSSIVRTSSIGESTSDSKTLQSSRSLSSLDRCSGISRIPTPKKPCSPYGSPPSRIPTFSPHLTSTPNLAIASSKPNPFLRHSIASSIPSPDFLLPERRNRWSSTEMLRSQSGASLVSGVSESDFSDLFVDLDESDSERSLRASSSSTDLLEDDDDDDEEFLESIRLQDDVVVKGHINICDLAGSERIKRSLVEGERLSELQHINLSLLELGNTIHALSEGNRTHIPYRNSSLTRLLQDSLGGNCKTSFVMCVSPRVIDLNETRCTLDFGQRAKQITTNAHVNIEVDFSKLAEDLRKRLEVQELEMKMQRENFERQALAIHDESEVKISELQAQLEMEREAQIERENQLEAEKEELKKLLEEEKRNSGVIAEHQKLLIENTLQQEIGNIARREQLERDKLSKQLEDEKLHSLLLVREKENMDKQLEEEKRRFNSRLQVERSKFEKELVEERNKYAVLTEEQLHQSPMKTRPLRVTLEPFELPSINIGSELSVNESSFETLFNVLLAEMMSLQLLYQIQDLSSACNVEAVRSRDSGWVDYDDDIIEAVGTNLLEKGGLLLTNLRAAKQGDTISVQSTDSLRDFLNLQLPQTITRPESKEKMEELAQFKVESHSKPVDEAPVKEDAHSDMSSEATRSGSSFSSEGSTCVRLSSSSNSTFGSYMEDEPLSPKRRMHPADSGCSSIYTDSDTDYSPNHKRYHDIPVIFEEPRANRLVSVPLALEEESDEFELDDEMEHIERPLDEKLSQLENHLIQLKSELDVEMFSFFSQVFGMDMSEQRQKETSSLTMRHLLEGLTQTLLENHGLPGTKEHDLSPAVMEESLNLLLVNKTVISCILVLKNRQQEAKKPDLTYNKTVIHVTPKVEKETQTDMEQPRTLRRRVRRDIGTITDLIVAKPEMREEGVQTNLAALLRPFEVLDSCSSSMSSLAPDDPWSKTLDEEMERSAVPDGASDVASDVNSQAENEPALANGASGQNLSSDEESCEDKLKQRKRRRSKVGSLLACFRPAFQRKASGSRLHESSRSETSKLVKE